MFDLNKVYWLYIASYVYCCIKKGQALLYNTQTGDCIETDRRDVIALLQLLYAKKNLGAIRCDEKMLQHSSLREFIAEFCKKGMGDLVDTALVPEKPVQMMPILNLQQDLEKLKKQEDRSIGEDVLRYLLELNVYLYTGCGQQCSHCDKYLHQNLCCSTFSDKKIDILDKSVFQNLLAQIRYGTVGKLNLLGGNLLEYPYYEELPELLANFRGHTHIWNHYTAFAGYKTFSAVFLQDITVTFPIKENLWKHCITLLKDKQAQFHFYITNIEEYKKTKSLTEEYKIRNYSIHPVYTEENDDFFKESVFMDRDDIFQKKIPFRHIFARQKLNTHFFGSLTVLANGEVYSNINNPSLGNVANETMFDIINKEMTINTSWRKIRDLEPCTDCLYQYLCPSPSNYEAVMNRMNLCHIKI